MAQLAKTFYPYDPLPAQDLNDMVGFMNGLATGVNFNDSIIEPRHTIVDQDISASNGYIKYTDGSMRAWVSHQFTTNFSSWPNDFYQHDEPLPNWKKEFTDILFYGVEASTVARSANTLMAADSPGLDGFERVRIIAITSTNRDVVVTAWAFGKWK